MEWTGECIILVIDDEQELVRAIEEALSQAGMEVVAAQGAEEGLCKFYQTQPDLVLLGVAQPDGEGWDLCRQLRQVSNLPIVMLTPDMDEADLLRGLNLGADDYLTKPFSLEVLQARIEALLRRTTQADQASTPRTYQAGDVSIDLETRRVTVGDTPVALTPKEFDLLACLVRNAGRTVTHQELLQRVWGSEYGSDVQYLSLYVWQLRNRIEENPRRPRRILTRRGLGYQFVPAV